MIGARARSHRMALAVIGAALAAAVLALLFAVQRQHQHAIEAEQARLATAAQVVEEHMQGVILAVDNLLRQVIEDIQRTSDDQPEDTPLSRRILAEAGRLLPGVGVLFLIDARGYTVASSVKEPLPKTDLADRQYFKDLAFGHEGLHIGRAIQGRVLPANYFTAARALRSGDGGFRGVIVAGIDIAFAERFYNSLDLGPEGIVGVYRTDGTGVVRHPFDERFLSVSVPTDVGGKFAAGRLGTLFHASPVDGVERLIAYREIPGLPLYVVVGKTAADILAIWRRETWSMAALAGMFLAVIALLTVVMLRGFRREERIQEALASSNERMNLTLRMVPVTLAELDRDLRYTWLVNPLTRIPAEQFLGKTQRDLIGPGGRELDKARREVLRTGKPRRLETALRFADGVIRHVDAIVEPRKNDKGNVVGLRSALIDVTERVHERQALIEAKAAADKASQAKSRFMAAASHDLRQPLQALRLYLEVLAGQVAGRLQTSAIDHAREAMVSVERLLGALLDMSRLEAGLIKPEVREVRMADLVAPVIMDCEAQAAEKGLKLRWRACRRPVSTDPVLFQRILRNLVVNAIRYTPQGGILVGCRRRGQMAHIEVWDTGVGIPADQLPLIFDEFYRTPDAEGTCNGGRGLGLSIVQRTAQLLDHALEVRSRPGCGTVFSIELPLVKADALVPPGPVSA